MTNDADSLETGSQLWLSAVEQTSLGQLFSIAKWFVKGSEGVANFGTDDWNKSLKDKVTDRLREIKAAGLEEVEKIALENGLTRDLLDKLFPPDVNDPVDKLSANVTKANIQATINSTMPGPHGDIFNEHLRQAVNRKTLHRLPDVASMVLAFMRNPTAEAPLDMLRREGFTDIAIQTMLATHANVLNAPEIMRSISKFGIKEEEVIELFGLLGYPMLDIKGKLSTLGRRVLDLNEITPSVSDAGEYLRRGLVDGEGYKDLLRHWGYDEKYFDILRDSSVNLFPPDVLFEMVGREILPQEDLEKELHKLGYLDEGTAKLLEMQHRKIDPIDLRSMYWRDIIKKEEYGKRLAKHRFSDKAIKEIQELSWIRPNPSDLIRFGVRDIFTPDIAKKFGLYEEIPPQFVKEMRKVGYDKEVTSQYWAAHWTLPSAGQGYDMEHRGIIDKPELKLLLKALDYSPYWRDKMIELNNRLVPRRVIPRLVKQGLLDDEGTKGKFKALGYSDADSAMMARSAKLQALGTERELSKGDILDSYTHGEINEAVAKTMLFSLRYDGGSVNLLIARAKRKKRLMILAAQEKADKEAAKNAKEETKGEIVTAYKLGMIDDVTAMVSLGELGYTVNTRRFIISLADLQKSRETKGTKSGLLRSLFMDGAVNANGATATLIGYGFGAEESRQLVDLWSMQANVERARKEAKLKIPSKTELGRWVLAGYIDVEQYVGYMEQSGYSDDLIAIYLMEVVDKARSKDND